MQSSTYMIMRSCKRRFSIYLVVAIYCSCFVEITTVSYNEKYKVCVRESFHLVFKKSLARLKG